MKIEEIALSRLRKTRLLKRSHPKIQMERCLHSLRKFGQYSPLVVSGNEVLCGTLVYDAMKRLKMRRAVVVQIGEISEEKKKELRYLDNRTFEMSFWKDDELKMFLMGLEKNVLEDCGFTEDEVEEVINGFRDEVKPAKKSVLEQLNEQPDEWYCPDCGWTGTLKKSDGQTDN